MYCYVQLLYIHPQPLPYYVNRTYTLIHSLYILLYSIIIHYITHIHRPIEPRVYTEYLYAILSNLHLYLISYVLYCKVYTDCM